MKILYLIDHLETNYPRDQNYIIRFMMERGHDVEVVTSKDPKFEQYNGFFFPRVKILRCPAILRVKKAKIYFNPIVLGKLYKTYDAVHSFTFFTFSSIHAILAKSNVKLIRAEVGPPDGLTFVKAKHGIYSLLVNMYKNCYDYFTAYNQVEKRSLELLGFPKERIIILPPMVDFERFSSLQRNFTDDLVSIGTIARISPEKGIHRIIPIMKKVLKVQDARPKYKLVLAGRIDDPNYARGILMNLRNMLGSSFAYLGEVAPPYSFYKNVDVVIVPSIDETGAITVLEAMSAGKIVIASNIYPINLYITDGINGFLFNTCGEASRKVLDIIENNVDVERITSKAREYAKKHDYKVVCRNLEEVYYRGSSR